MNIAIVVVTHNRLEYTRKCLERLLADPTEEFDLYIWDNASADDTPQYLKDAVKDSRVKEVVLSRENLGQTAAMNYVWGKTEAELIAKVDNDCLVTPGWTRILSAAHRDIERLGAVACWHYPIDEFDEETARRKGKIQSFGSHQILRHPWVCGSGFMMKRSTFQRHGPWKLGRDAGTTNYFLRMALSGMINGWHYPFVVQEHMDDPKSAHSMVTNDESVNRMYEVTFTLRAHEIRDMKSRWDRRKVVLADLNVGPWQAECYVGWRGRLNRLLGRIWR